MRATISECLNKLEFRFISLDDLFWTWKRLGADVPFFVHWKPRNWNRFGDVIGRIGYFNLMLYSKPHFNIESKNPEAYQYANVLESLIFRLKVHYLEDDLEEWHYLLQTHLEPAFFTIRTCRKF